MNEVNKKSVKNYIISLFNSVFSRRKKTENLIEIKDNTFILWELCSQSHAEVVPGYAKYLLDLGYHVSVIINPERYKEGLFERFPNADISYNKISRKDAKKYFKHSDLSNISGLMITTAGKLCDSIHYEQCYENFAPNFDKAKLFLVEHDCKSAVDYGSWREDLIVLRKLNYKNAKAVVVNPHYFGDVKISSKNKITNFITIGAIKSYRKNSNLIIDAVKTLHSKGVRNFKVTVVGKGHLKGVSKEIQSYFDIKGRLPFRKMYDEIEKADFILSAYDKDNPSHTRYNTTGTSGNFQLSFGFLKPILIVRDFAPINGFNDKNSILYDTKEDYSAAMEKAINLPDEDYQNIRNSLKEYADNLYKESLNNLRSLINGK